MFDFLEIITGVYFSTVHLHGGCSAPQCTSLRRDVILC